MARQSRKMVCEHPSGAPARAVIGGGEQACQPGRESFGPAAVNLAHSPSGRPLHQLAAVAQTTGQHLFGLPRRDPAQHLQRLLPHQRIVRLGRQPDLSQCCLGRLIPQTIELLQQFGGIGGKRLYGRVPAFRAGSRAG